MTLEHIARAHVLGAFGTARYRTIMVQFGAFITKYQILSSSSKLKDNLISIAEKYSLDAGLVRKSLLQHQEREGSVFKLRLKKVFQNGKCFM